MVLVKRMLISGLVQGVGYRFFAVREARAAGINGFVRNLPDGRVEVVAEATSEAELESFADALRRGPPTSVVRGVEIEDYPHSESIEGFEIKY